jgi:hypothetical protein
MMRVKPEKKTEQKKTKEKKLSVHTNINPSEQGWASFLFCPSFSFGAHSSAARTKSKKWRGRFLGGAVRAAWDTIPLITHVQN